MSTASIRRVAKELKDFNKKPIREFCLVPLESNMLEVHFTMLGPEDSPYAGGLYHGRVIIPSEYPFAPPDCVLLTPNGRFELGKKICLSVSSYHPEHWKATWGIGTILHSLRSFMLTAGTSGIASINYPAEKRREMAKESIHFECKECGCKVSEQWEEIMKDAPPATDADKGELLPPAPPTPTAGPAAAAEGAVADDNNNTTNTISAAAANGADSASAGGTLPSPHLLPTASSATALISGGGPSNPATPNNPPAATNSVASAAVVPSAPASSSSASVHPTTTATFSSAAQHTPLLLPTAAAAANDAAPPLSSSSNPSSYSASLPPVAEGGTANTCSNPSTTAAAVLAAAESNNKTTALLDSAEMRESDNKNKTMADVAAAAAAVDGGMGNRSNTANDNGSASFLLGNGNDAGLTPANSCAFAMTRDNTAAVVGGQEEERENNSAAAVALQALPTSININGATTAVVESITATALGPAVAAEKDGHQPPAEDGNVNAPIGADAPAPPAADEAPAAPHQQQQQPRPAAPINNDNNNLLDFEISVRSIDRALFVSVSIFVLMLIKKAVFDWPATAVYFEKYLWGGNNAIGNQQAV